MITVAANQTQATRELDNLGVLHYLGDSHTITTGRIADAVWDCISSPLKMIEQSQTAKNLVDGRGASRCVDAMLNLV